MRRFEGARVRGLVPRVVRGFVPQRVRGFVPGMVRGFVPRRVRGLVPPIGRRGDGGFTLIELLIVITIIIVLAGIGLATYGSSLARSKEAALKQDLFAMRDAIDQYYADRNKYPSSLQDLVTEKYIRMVPVDPFTGSAETWQTVMAEPDVRNPTAEIGIYDVKSGATQTAIDGTPYAEW